MDRRSAWPRARKTAHSGDRAGGSGTGGGEACDIRQGGRLGALREGVADAVASCFYAARRGGRLLFGLTQKVNPKGQVAVMQSNERLD